VRQLIGRATGSDMMIGGSLAFTPSSRHVPVDATATFSPARADRSAPLHVLTRHPETEGAVASDTPAGCFRIGIGC
jgi:hypothetical protein